MPNSPLLRHALSRKVTVLVAVSLTTIALTASPQSAEAAPSCSAFTSKVYDQVNPGTRAQGLSATAAGYATLQSQGFTSTRETTMTASPRAGTSLAAVHRLYRASNRNVFYSRDTAEIARAVRVHGYVDQGIAFYAAASGASCLAPVWSYYYPGRGLHRFTVSASEGQELVAAGWRKEIVRFHLGKQASSAFTIAVIPDTQPEVWRAGDPRFAQRTDWLVANKSGLDLRFVTHTGDVVDWDTPAHDHYVRARAALTRLNGQIPYSITIGNHDTAAVGVGGSAADPPTTWKTVRDTTTANAYLNEGTAAMRGAFESGKIDNAYHTFSAGGRDWMMLNLELWPRRSVVAWANQVVRAHPRHNVMVATHSFMLGNGAIYQRSDYGETSPQYLYDNLLRVNPNVKVILSGHTSTSAYRELPGANGGKIHSFLLTMHDRVTNPTRVIEINPADNTVASFVYSPYTKKTYPTYEVKARTAGWVR